MGLKGSSVPIFAAENSPAKIRGALGKPSISYSFKEHLDGRQSIETGECHGSGIAT